MKKFFSEFLWFRNFQSSISLFVACLAGSNYCDIILSGLFPNSSNHCQIILSIGLAWFLLWTLNTKKKVLLLQNLTHSKPPYSIQWSSYYFWKSIKTKYRTLLVDHSSKSSTMLPELVKNIFLLNNTTYNSCVRSTNCNL